MKDSVEKVRILRITKGDTRDVDDEVTKEQPLTIVLNNQELVTLLCSPIDLEYLAVGFLFSEGLIRGKDEIRRIILDEQRSIVRVETEEDKDDPQELLFKRLITSGCGRGASLYSTADIQAQTKVESQSHISPSEVFTLVRSFQHRSQVYRATGGVHSAALCDIIDILIFKEDIGRHNAIDKIFGECVLAGIPTNDRIILTSGRISSEILLKVAKRGIPMLISKSAPTDLGVRLAEHLGVTLIGFVRGERMNIYTHGWRIVN